MAMLSRTSSSGVQLTYGWLLLLLFEIEEGNTSPWRTSVS